MGEFAVISSLAALLLSNVGIWVREYYKHKSWKNDNGHLEDIKKTTESLKVQQGKIMSEIKSIKSGCKETRERFEKSINETREKLWELHGKE